MKKTLILCIAVLCLIVSWNSIAIDNIAKLKGIKIKANNEAPQVMYIIPWQNPEGAERLYAPIKGAKIERLKPLDPYTFELEIGLHKQWKDNI